MPFAHLKEDRVHACCYERQPYLCLFSLAGMKNIFHERLLKERKIITIYHQESVLIDAHGLRPGELR